MGIHKGHKQSQEHKKRLSEAALAFWSKPENKERMRQIRIARPNASGRGWHHSETSREKISKSMKRYWSSSKRRRKGKQ